MRDSTPVTRRCRGLALLFAVVLATAAFPPARAEDALQALVSRANTHANAEEYPQAIALYEQAVKAAPGQAVLKRNLAILYTNYGTRLQEQKLYDQADVLFDKALALLPQEREPLRAKALGHFQRALDVREAGVAAGKVDYPAMRAHLEKALALDGEERNYRKSMASAYLGEARGLAEQERFDEAIPLLEKALEHDPEAPALKQSLANVCLGKARLLPEAERKPWADRALSLDNSPVMQEKAKQVLALKAGDMAGMGATAPQHGFLAGAQNNNNTNRVLPRELPKEAATLTLDEMLRDVERELDTQPSATAPLEDVSLKGRVEALETRVFGKPAEGGLNIRAKNLYAAVFGKSAGVLPPVSEQGQAPVETAENTYLAEIFKFTDGKVIRWQKFPLRVSIEEPKIEEPQIEKPEKLAGYRPEYRQAVLDGLDRWKAATNNFVTYIVVKNSLAADVQITFTDTYEDRYDAPEEAPAGYDDVMKGPSQNKRRMIRLLQLASMFAPGYFGLAPQAVAAGLQYQEVKKLQVLIDESKMALGLNVLQGLPPEQALERLRNQAAYEFGHILGLKGTSPEPGDLMHPGALSATQPVAPSRRDIETLRQLYARPANIVLNVR